MINVILAKTHTNGIGLENSLPWKIKDDLKKFKSLTLNNTLLMGRKTIETLPKLKNRTIDILSRTISINDCNYKNKVRNVFSSLDDAINFYLETKEIVFVCGGAEVYNQMFSKWKNVIDNLYLSDIKKNYECDTYIKFELSEWTISDKDIYDEFIFYKLSPTVSDESKYLKLLKEVRFNGEIREGRNGKTYSLFGKNLEFDLTKGFPVLTYKKMFFRGIVEELLFFIRGHTDSSLLETKRINIWKGNTSREFLNSNKKEHYNTGSMGPMYGYQWRHFNAKYNYKDSRPEEEGLDQLKQVIYKIRNEPNSRRIILTDYNPLQSDEGVLYPCHSIIIQFYVSGDYLDMSCYNRSQDLFLGTPFNITSSSLLLTLIAQITDKKPRRLVMNLGDCHIYDSHLNSVYIALSRIPYRFPSLCIKKKLCRIEDIELLEYKDFELVNYDSHGKIKARMIS